MIKKIILTISILSSTLIGMDHPLDPRRLAYLNKQNKPKSFHEIAAKLQKAREEEQKRLLSTRNPLSKQEQKKSWWQRWICCAK